MASVFGVPVESLIHNTSLLNFLLDRFSNNSSKNSVQNERSHSLESEGQNHFRDETWTALQNDSSIVTHFGNATHDVMIPLLFNLLPINGESGQGQPSMVNGSFMLKYSNQTERDTKIWSISNLWHTQFGEFPPFSSKFLKLL